MRPLRFACCILVFLHAALAFPTTYKPVELRGVRHIDIVCNSVGLPVEAESMCRDIESQVQSLATAGGLSSRVVDEGANFTVYVTAKAIDLECFDGYVVDIDVGFLDSVSISRLSKRKAKVEIELETWNLDAVVLASRADLRNSISDHIDYLVQFFLDEVESVKGYRGTSRTTSTTRGR